MRLLTKPTSEKHESALRRAQRRHEARGIHPGVSSKSTKCLRAAGGRGARTGRTISVNRCLKSLLRARTARAPATQQPQNRARRQGKVRLSLTRESVDARARSADHAVQPHNARSAALFLCSAPHPAGKAKSTGLFSAVYAREIYASVWYVQRLHFTTQSLLALGKPGLFSKGVGERTAALVLEMLSSLVQRIVFVAPEVRAADVSQLPRTHRCPFRLLCPPARCAPRSPTPPTHTDHMALRQQRKAGPAVPPGSSGDIIRLQTLRSEIRFAPLPGCAVLLFDMTGTLGAGAAAGQSVRRPGPGNF